MEELNADYIAVARVRTSRSTMRNTLVASVVAVLVAALAGGCSIFNASPADSSVFCDGIATEMGGCDPARPTFVALSCDEVAVELGEQYGARALAIMDGPAVVDDESQSVRLAQLMVSTIQLVNKHLRDHDLVKQCSADDLMKVIERVLPGSFKDRIGSHLYDTTKADYSEWRAEFLGFLRVVDEDEDEPY